ncbi:MAG: molybdenum cofactor biosynthesis protein MoaE [Desulfovibrio sp.]
MDITQAIAELKKEPEFTDNVGMILVHNGIVRGWSRKDHQDVSAVNVKINTTKVQEICTELMQREGIFRVIAEGFDGVRKAGDDLLFIIVAGDIRENVKPVLAEALDRIKSEAVSKHEIAPDGSVLA